MEFALIQLHLILFVLLSSSILCESEDLKYEGTFWHITDIHVDQNYSRSGNPKDLCHKSVNYTAAKNDDAGIFGNVLCDSPQQLLDLSIQAMVEIEPKPDFIIWLGDNLPHTRNPNPEWDVVLTQIKNITLQLRDAFQNVTIYPSIGNHDTYPPNILSPRNYSTVYEDYFEKGGWKYILPESTWATFKRGGYYSHSSVPNLRVVSLNTILWYESNSLVKTETDSYQFEFLKDELKAAYDAHEKVYIIGHVSPGYYNRIYNGTPSTPLYHLQYLKKYLDIIKNYADVIAGQFYGHIHNDMFQLYYCDTGKAYSSGLLAASVTPWHSNTPRNINVSIPVNPSLRLMYYNRTSQLLLDYEQYYLNLTKANKEPSKVPLYELLYKFVDTYGVNNLSTTALVDVYERLKVNETLFQLFFKYLTAGKQTVGCDDVCKTAQLCSMASTSESEYSSCMKPTDGDLILDNNYHTVAYIISFVCIFIGIAAIALFLYYRNNNWQSRRNERSNPYFGL